MRIEAFREGMLPGSARFYRYFEVGVPTPVIDIGFNSESYVFISGKADFLLVIPGQEY